MDKIAEAIQRIDVHSILNTVQEHGATSVHVLDDETRACLVKEALCAAYEPQPEYLSSGVREDLSSCEKLDPDGPCRTFARELETHIHNSTKHRISLFSRPLRFDAVVIQRYDVGSGGVSPHRDFSHSIDLICVFIIDGHGRFCLCDDRSGSNPRQIPTLPGDLAFMRGPGFMDSDYRPFHFVDRITTRRFTLGMRCIK